MPSKRSNHHHPEIRLPDLPDRQDWRDQQDRLDELNDLWDTLATGDRRPRPRRTWNPIRLARSRHSDPEAAAQVTTIRALDRADDTPDPDTQFLRDLRSALMDTTHAVPIGVFDQSPSVSPPGGFAPPLTLSPIRPSVLRRFSGTSMRILELAAVAALLLTMVGFAAGNRGIQDIRALLPAGQNDADLDSAAYLGNAAHTGELSGPGPEGPIGLLWGGATAGYAWTPDSSPVAADGILYLTTRTTDAESRAITTALVALDLQTGQTIWETPLPGFVYDASRGAPVVIEGTVYVSVSLERWLGGPPATPEAGATPEGTAHMAGAVIALDAQTGQELWTFDDLPRAGDSSPVVADGTLYIVAEDGTLYALDAGSGVPFWTAFPTPDPSSPNPKGFATAPTVAGDTVYIPTMQGNLIALDSADGTERWSAPIGHFLPSVAVVSGDTALISTLSGSGYAVGPPDEEATPDPDPAGETLFAFDAATGEQRWALDTEGQVSGAPTVAEDVVLVTGDGANSTDIVARSIADGSEQWRTSTGNPIITPAVWSGAAVYVGSTDSKLYALDLATGAIQWEVATGGSIQTTPAVADGIVAFTSNDGHVYALAATPPNPNAATPAASTGEALDISGMPACTTSPRPDFVVAAPNGVVFAPEGTPAATSTRPDYAANEMNDHGILFADLPEGDPAPPEVADAIQVTISEMAACSRPGHEAQLASYYSDDYFRRRPVLAPVGYLGLPISVPTMYTEPFESATVLEDGRIAMLFTYEATTSDPDDEDGIVRHGNLVVWTQIDGRWVIDEVLEVSEEPILG